MTMRQKATVLMIMTGGIASLLLVGAILLAMIGKTMAAAIWIILAMVNIYLYWVNMTIYRRHER